MLYEVITPHGRIDKIEEAAENVVLVDVGHLLEGGEDIPAQWEEGLLLATQGVVPLRIDPKPRLEIPEEEESDLRVVDEGEGDPFLGIGRSDLKVIVAVSPEDVDLPPS